jgi:hypothetical protein
LVGITAYLAIHHVTYVRTYVGLTNQCPHSCDPLNPKALILIQNTGASYGLTPFMSDFIDNVSVRDITKVNNVIGIGTTLHKFTNIKGFPLYLPCVLYHLPETDVHLLSPQTYCQMHIVYLKVYDNCVCMLLKTSTINTCIVMEEHSLYFVFGSFVSGKAEKALASNMHSGLCHTHLNALDFSMTIILGILGNLHNSVHLIWSIFQISAVLALGRGGNFLLSLATA